MESTERALIILLAGSLTLFLLLAIIAIIKVIQIINDLKRIAEKAEQIADKAGTVGELLGRAAKPIALGRLFALVGSTIAGRTKQRKNRRETSDA